MVSGARSGAGGLVAADLVETHCPFCALNCGLRLEVTRNRVTDMSTWPESPLTSGALCIKGRLAHEQVHHPERLTRPLLRTGNDFTEIDWDEAFSRTVRGFTKIADKRGRDANAVLSGGSLTNEKVYLIGKLARLGLGTRHVDYNGRFCMSSAAAANMTAFGRDRMMTPLAELQRADVAVIVGANLSAAFPVRIPPLIDGIRKRGGRVVVIDPRASRFVKPDDLHLPIRPSTDAVLFGGLLREIAEQGLVDTEFVANRTSGFNEAIAAVQSLTLERVASICDIAPELVREAATVIAGTRSAMWLHGRGPEQQIGGVDNVLALINVGLACGHVGRPGAGINMLTGQRNGQGGREWGQRCNQLPAGRNIENAEHREVVADRWGIDEESLPGAGRTYVEILEMAGRGEIKGLLSICTNMSVSAPDLHSVGEQMAALDHVVVVDPFFSESARHADIVFPGSVFAEESGTITTIEGRVVRIDQAVSPVPGLSDLDILRELGERFGVGDQFAFESAEMVFDEMRAVSAGGPVDYAGITWERLRSEPGVFWPCPSLDHPGTPQLYTERFAHPDGRARFHPLAPLDESVEHVDELVLTTGRVLSQFLSGNQTMRISGLDRRATAPVLEVHPTTARRVGLEEGELAQVSSKLASSVLAWTANADLRTDTVFLPYHWPECNRLIAADLDPISGIPGFKYTAISLAPAPGGSDPAADGAVPVGGFTYS